MKERWSNNVDVQKIVDKIVEIFDGELISYQKRGMFNGEPVLEVVLKLTNDFAEEFIASYYFNVYGMIVTTKADEYVQLRNLKYCKPLFEIVEECNKGKIINGLTYREAFKQYHIKLRAENLQKKAEEAKLKYIKYINDKLRVGSEIDEFLLGE